MKKLLPYARILTYPQLAHFGSVEELLEAPHGGVNKDAAVVILYVTDKSFEGGTEFLDGHWTCLFITRDGELEYFDPYGEPVDTPLKELSPHERAKLGESRFLLYDLLREFVGRGGNVRVNTIPFQADRKDVATCGRQCAFRIVNRALTDEEYARKISADPRISPDVFVTLATEDALGHARHA